MKKLWFMLAMMICILASCSDGGSEEPVNPTPKPEEVKTEITIDSGIISNGLSFGVTEGEQSISFSVNANWTLSVASTTSGTTWCKASATSGSKGSATVKFTVDENTGYDDRSVSVTIKAGSVSKTFTITQKGADALLVTTTKYEVAQEGGQIEIEVKANIDYKMEISEKAKDWIKESSSRALTTSKHKLDIAMNENAEKREGEITFKSGDKVETVKVYQAGGAILLLSQNEYTVSDAGETISVDIKSNIDFGVQMPEVDWISDEASSRGMSSHTLKYIVAVNETYDSRSAEIVFYDKNSDLKDTLKVVQAQKNAIVISKKRFDVKVEGDTIEVDLNSNIDYEILIPDTCSWIKEQLASRGLINSKHYFIVEENETQNNRLGVVLISSEILTDTIYINQRTASPLLSEQRKYEFGHMGGEIEVEYINDIYYYRDIPDWLSITYLSYDFRNFLEINAKENLSLDRREHKLLLMHNEQVIDTLTIVQEPKPNIIVRTRAGFLKSVLENPLEIYSLKIIGELNGEDLEYLRSLSDGSWHYPQCRNSILAHLDLSEASLIDDAWLSFENCVKLQSITLPLSLKFFGDSSFEGCEKLKDVYFNGDLSSWCKVKRSCNVTYPPRLFYKLHVAGYTLMNGEEFVEITIPDDIAEIEEGAFSYCNSISAVKTSTNTVVIGETSFFECRNLVKVDMPEVITIERHAFDGCTNLTDINIPKVTDVKLDGFSNCDSLTTISLPSMYLEAQNNQKQPEITKYKPLIISVF
ncbi:MAG: leucine-rich repeat protein [Bacteroides sp.]|nr:leucine-rich repeat protein [Bacteroides sp.]